MICPDLTGRSTIAVGSAVDSKGGTETAVAGLENPAGGRSGAELETLGARLSGGTLTDGAAIAELGTVTGGKESGIARLGLISRSCRLGAGF